MIQSDGEQGSHAPAEDQAQVAGQAQAEDKGLAKGRTKGAGRTHATAKAQGGRLIVVSNRVGPLKDTGRAGGLAVALVDTLRRTGGLWFGWSGEVS